MNFIYDPYRDTFTRIDDESSSYQIVQQVELSDECIQKIAESIAEALEKVRAKGMQKQNIKEDDEQ